jgi:hypothetical protein
VTNSLYVVSLSGRGTALLELGLFSRLFQQDPMGTGYFRPIGNRPDGMDTHVDLIVDTFGLQDDKKAMTAVDYATAGENGSRTWCLRACACVWRGQPALNIVVSEPLARKTLLQK